MYHVPSGKIPRLQWPVVLLRVRGGLDHEHRLEHGRDDMLSVHCGPVLDGIGGVCMHLMRGGQISIAHRTNQLHRLPRSQVPTLDESDVLL